MIKIRKFYENAVLPTRGTKQSAGLDLYAYLEEESTIIKRGEIKFVHTGISVVFDEEDEAGLVFSRSGLSSKHGICLANGVGVIDSDYTGEIIVPLINLGKNDYCLNKFDRIAQLLIHKIKIEDVEEVLTSKKTDRGSGGFGSTGENLCL